MSGRIALKDALDRHGQRAIERNRSIRRGTVVTLSPLTVDVHEYDHPLTLADDFEMSQWAALYQKAIGLKVGDLVLMHQEVHDWTMVDVVSDTALPTKLGGQTATKFKMTPGYTADRTMNPQSTTLAEVATVLATLIDDLRKAKIIP